MLILSCTNSEFKTPPMMVTNIGAQSLLFCFGESSESSQCLAERVLLLRMQQEPHRMCGCFRLSLQLGRKGDWLSQRGVASSWMSTASKMMRRDLSEEWGLLSTVLIYITQILLESLPSSNIITTSSNFNCQKEGSPWLHGQA